MKRYLIQTFGCQMNVHDSERIEEALGSAGYAATDEAALADLIIMNTCSVREKAEHKLMSFLGRLRELKETRPGLVLAVAGCVAQQEGERLLKRAPFLDLVFGPDNIPELPELLAHLEGGAPPTVRTVFDLDSPQFLVAQPGSRKAPISTYVTVMKGCDERCTFCIVPYTRGPERYRHADEIVEEVRALVASGVREVTLLGQTVNSWYEPRTETQVAPPVSALGRKSISQTPPSEFAALLHRIAQAVPGLRRLRYTSPHPRHVTPELLEAHATLDVLAAHVHLPVQSGSNRVLRRMSRRYTREEYIERAHALQVARPGLTLSADLIVGFPGETDEDFELSLSLVREAGFVAAFAFKYSPRPYTPALKFGDDVPEEVKDERLTRLFEAVEVQQTRHLQSLVGSRQEVLVTGKSTTQSRRFSGRSARNEIVHIDTQRDVDPMGEIVSVIIEQANKHSLVGRLDEASPASHSIPLATSQIRERVRLPVVDSTRTSIPV